MNYTLEDLKKNNTAYACKITAELCDHINKLVERIEQTRTDRPQPLDNVDYTDEYGQRFEHATIESAGVTSLTPQICEHCTIEPVIHDDGTVGGTVGCGGAFHKFNADKMTYKGTEQKTFKIYGGDYISGYYPIYFDCMVSSFEYDARKI